MRLGFHYHTPAIAEQGKIRMPGYLGLFIDSLTKRCEWIVCFQHSPLAHELTQMDYTIKSENVSLVNIGPHASIPLRTATAFIKRKIFRKWQNELDVMLVRASTPLLPVLASAWKKPLALLMVSDAAIGIENLPQPGWRKKIIQIWAKWYQRQQMQIAQNVLTFVNSRLLYDQYQRQVPNLIETRTTTLSENDFYIRRDTCETTPYRLLYTGRMTRIKGLFEIVETLSQLVNSGFDVVLDLVGMVDHSDPVLDEIGALARTLRIGDRVKYHGYKTAGPELLAYYRRADIYIIASQASSEGFPRTIWEAMASSLPVVATKAGSIPAFISDAAVLVPPKQVDTLTQAVKDVLTNSNLRQRLIQKGMALARNNTLEMRAEEIITKIEQWLEFGALPSISTSQSTNGGQL